jgi:hypothetical protein
VASDTDGDTEDVAAARGGGGGGDQGDEGSSSDGDPFAAAGTGGAGGQGGDEEFEESLGDFDRGMSREQDELARAGSGPSAYSRVSGAADSGGVGADGGAAGDASGVAAGGGSEGDGVAVRDLGPDSEALATVEGCNDQDRVARQLCEAATKEDDPFLRAALWDEYNEYRKLEADSGR